MSKRNPLLFLQDILDSIEKIEIYTRDIDFTGFRNNPMIIDAVVRNLEIIGEAAAKLPARILKKYPTVPWSKMKAIRNKVIHEYFGIDFNITWKTVKKSLPALKLNIVAALEQEKKEIEG